MVSGTKRRSAGRQGKDSELEVQIGAARAMSSRQALATIRVLRAETRLGSESVNLLCQAGGAELDAHRYQLAVEFFEWANGIHQHPAILNNLALAQLELQDFQTAIQNLARAVAIDERFTTARLNLGIALIGAKEYDDAILELHKAIETGGASADVYGNLGIAHFHALRYKEAAVWFRKTTELRPNDANAWIGMGDSLNSLKEPAAAEFAYRKAIELEPGNHRARMALGNNLYHQSRLEEAKEQYDLSRAGGNADLIDLRCAQLLSALPSSISEIEESRRKFANEIDRLTERTGTVEKLPASFALTNFYLPYHGLNDRELQSQWAAALLKICPSLAWTAPHCEKPRQNGRLKMGFISSRLKSHTIAKFTNGLIAQLPRDRFEVTVFDLSLTNDPGDLAAIADKVVVCGRDLDENRAAIAAHELDVAFYPEIGMHPLAYILALSRLAPVQCSTWGHPVTTGIPAMDYFLSSDLIEPAEASDHYSENLVRLSTMPTYYPSVSASEVHARPIEFPLDWHTYLCPQTLFKFHPEIDHAIGGLLRRDPQGRLLLIATPASLKAPLLRRLSVNYADVVDRILFFDAMDRDKLLGLMRAADVMVDTWAFGGGNTSYEALALGTPIVTMPGEFMRGRVTAGLYQKMNLLDCIAESPDEYVSKAIAIASDRELKTSLRDRILQSNGVLYEERAAVEEMAQFFEAAVAKSQA